MVTRYDRIISLTKEEMAKFFNKVNCANYDLLQTDSCSICNFSTFCDVEDSLQYYIDWLSEEDE